jgi:4-hydroxythreonine-4-phosphate dehydrogenase
MIAVTMGDPAGIGPEVIVKALAARRLREIGVTPVVVGDERVIRAAAATSGVDLPVRGVRDLDDVADGEGAVVLDLGNADPQRIPLGEVSAAAGRASMEAIERATELTRAGKLAALVTAPINKEATNAAGYHDVGHLEYLARVTGSTEYATMLVTKTLRVVHLTTHYSLRNACELVTKERVLGKLRLTHTSFAAWGLRAPRIAAAALNPHGGESGLFGDEEMTEIGPAVEQARAEGIDARGPYPADSVFNRAIDGEFDVVVAMYHDQGHIPIKVHGFEESVSVSLGLPLIRTSVDHGTAFDIAGKNRADATSMVEAIDVAAKIVAGRWPE